MQKIKNYFTSKRNLGKKTESKPVAQKKEDLPAADAETKRSLTEPFTSTQFGKMNNRVALAAMTRARATKEGVVGAHHAEYYSQRASGAVLITEGVFISDAAKGWWCAPGIYTEEQIGAWKAVTDAVHKENADTTFLLQLWHVGRSSHSDYQPDGQPPYSASDVKHGGGEIHVPGWEKKEYEVPRPMTEEVIKATVEDYGKAAKAAKEVGFDGVEIHAANGYIIDQFLQSRTNKRTDEYGGSVENRLKFLKLVVERVAKEWDLSKVAVKLGPNGNYNDMGSEDNLEQFDAAVKYLAEQKVGIIEMVDGLAFGFHELTEQYKLERAKNIINDVQKDLPAGERTLLMGNCGYTKETAEEAIEAGHADMISFGRPYITNPDLVERFKGGIELATKDGYDHLYTPNTPDPSVGYTDFPKAS
eukprot:snap_masked-scaffold_1-processed-gene-6.15-mRNA-1 protein AED:0.04 eAED:0.04 QI:0/-1/0/1/-1/1/1/0/416